MGTVLDFLKDCKDSAVAETIARLASSRIGRYGTIQSVDIDSATRRLRVSLMLDGEREPIAVEAERYEIVTDGGLHYLVLHGVTASRPWAQALLEDLLAGRRIRLPGALAYALKHLA
ncbi:MAG TPA: hypothetical protein PLW83_00090 [Deltaproteobacteria bacterium]|nr:hypothetical protein [Deltaproteobacteria bacterium]